MNTQENNPHIDNQVEVGMRIKLIAMHDDPDPVPPGTIGEVINVSNVFGDTIIGVKWENGRTLNVIKGVDKYELLTSREESDDLINTLINMGENKKSKSDIKVSNTFKSEFSKKGVRDIKFESNDIKRVTPIKDIAKKHGVSIDKIKKEIELGTEIELEHTKDPKQKSDRALAKKIATHHVEEFKDYYSNKKHGLISNEKELEETTMAGGGASTGAFVGPLGNKPIKRNSVYGESYTIKVSDLLSEISSTASSKLRNGGGFDGNAWVGDKKNDGWNFNDKPTFHEDGEIVDILAKLDIDWTDDDLTVLTKESITEGIKKLSEEKHLLDEGKIEEFSNKLKNAVKKKIDTNKDVIKKLYNNAKRAHNDIKSGEIKTNKESQKNLKNVIKDIAKLGGQAPLFLIPGGGISLIAAKKLIPVVGKVLKLSVEEYKENKANGKITKTPEDDEETVDETTTHGSVWGGQGPPVGKIFAASGKKSDSGKKPSYAGGTIVQSIPNEGVLTNEVNDIKYVKGGKFVKFKNKCVKYRNQDFCSSGNMDNPLILSDKTSDNIDEVSKKMGIPKEQIFEMIIKNREKRN